MEKLKKKSEKLKVVVVGGLLMITPLLPTSIRFKYLFFIVNILIIAVGAEAGLLSFLLQTQPQPPSLFPQKPKIIISDNDDDDDAVVYKPAGKDVYCSSENITAGVAEAIRGGGDELMIEDNCELYEKSETFIGNFYKQLKMQREES